MKASSTCGYYGLAILIADECPKETHIHTHIGGCTRNTYLYLLMLCIYEGSQLEGKTEKAEFNNEAINYSNRKKTSTFDSF